MSKIIFARTRWPYDSYADFWRLVELSGYETCYVDEIDMQSKNAYITTPMNGDYRAHLKNHPQRQCSLFLWMLERPGDASLARFRSDNRELLERNLVDVIIASDQQMAADCGFHFVPMGSHPGLCEKPPDKVKKYDVIGLMSYCPRRSFLFSNPSFPKERLAPGISQASNAWGGERADLLAASKFMINIHQDNYPYCESLRFALAAAYRLLMISEIQTTTWYQPFTIESVREHLLDNIRWGLSHYNTLRAIGEGFYQVFCIDNTFRTFLEEYL